jgi:hypothetical protein
MFNINVIVLCVTVPMLFCHVNSVAAEPPLTLNKCDLAERNGAVETVIDVHDVAVYVFYFSCFLFCCICFVSLCIFVIICVFVLAL